MRVALVAYLYPGKIMGGAEYQTLLLAQGLADLGHDVTFIATHSDKESVSKVGQINVLKIPGWRNVGWTLHRQLIKKAIQESAPDICYVRVFEELATLASLCKEAGVPVVSTSTHAWETSPFWFSRYLEENITHLRSFLSIRSSEVHVCNTKSLQRKIQRWFPRKSVRTIYNGQPIPPLDSIHHESSGQVIWVNNLKRFKRPEVFVELAHSLPQFRFVMIGRMYEDRYGKKMRSVLQQASANFQYLGPMPIEQVNAMIRQSDLLLYTSQPVEGFGNSFLQAWFRGVPTVSLSFDLDGILEREQIGRCPATFEQLVTDVEELMQDEATRRDMGRRAREYAVRHHNVEKMVASHEALFKEIVGNTTQGDPITIKSSTQDKMRVCSHG